MKIRNFHGVLAFWRFGVLNSKQNNSLRPCFHLEDCLNKGRGFLS